jgi:hypothetical protein
MLGRPVSGRRGIMTPQNLANATTLRRLALPLAVIGAFLWPAFFSAGSATAQQQVTELEDADVFFELNATDGDVGIQAFLDGDAWREVGIQDPDGRKIVDVTGKGGLKELGLTELFFESDEPELAELPFAELLLLFPEGEYTFEGRTVEHSKLVGTDELTADLPCPVEIISPVEDEEVPVDALTIRWTPVPGVFDPDTSVCTSEDEVELVGFQVVVELENEAENLLRVFSVDLPPDATELPVPEEFLVEAMEVPGTEVKVEILAIEASGNKTITERPFAVLEPDTLLLAH